MRAVASSDKNFRRRLLADSGNVVLQTRRSMAGKFRTDGGGEFIGLPADEQEAMMKNFLRRR
jgi:hypothetical protein